MNNYNTKLNEALSKYEKAPLIRLQIKGNKDGVIIEISESCVFDDNTVLIGCTVMNYKGIKHDYSACFHVSLIDPDFTELTEHIDYIIKEFENDKVHEG